MYLVIDFNPRSRKESDAIIKLQINLRILFQSTLPQGERLYSYSSPYPPYSNFNPRSRKESDLISPFCTLFRRQISIHAPARRATISPMSKYFSFIISIHAPARRATICSIYNCMIIDQFQSTLPQGERHYRRGQIYPGN